MTTICLCVVLVHNIRCNVSCSKSIDDLIAEFGQMTDDHTLDLQLGVVTEEDAKQLSGKKK